jgi:hypothetical protein
MKQTINGKNVDFAAAWTYVGDGGPEFQEHMMILFRNWNLECTEATFYGSNCFWANEHIRTFMRAAMYAGDGNVISTEMDLEDHPGIGGYSTTQENTEPLWPAAIKFLRSKAGPPIWMYAVGAAAMALILLRR